VVIGWLGIKHVSSVAREHRGQAGEYRPHHHRLQVVKSESMMKDRTPCQVVSFIQHLASPVQIQSNQNNIPTRSCSSRPGRAQTHTDTKRERCDSAPSDWLASDYCLAAVSHLSQSCLSFACVARGRSEHGSNRKRGKRGRVGGGWAL
jgi:hypothetical protein